MLGAGFGGLELTTRLSEEFGEDTDVVLIDKNDAFVFGFSKLDVMFGRQELNSVRHPYAELIKPGVRFVRSEIRSIDPAAKRVETDAGAFEGDYLVIALGAAYDPAATPGLLEAGHEFYSVAGAAAAREVIADFDGGRVVVAVCGTPYKCPPAPSETALLMHDHLTKNGLRDRSTITLVTPLPSPIPPAPDASRAVLQAFAERDIDFRSNSVISRIDPDRKVAVMADTDDVVPFDLFLGVPKHRVPAVVDACGLAVDGWIPVDPHTLETSVPGVYAVGDVTSVGTPKAGAFAEGQAATVADRLIASARAAGELPTYGGRGACYLEFGNGQVGLVEVTFLPGQPPTGTFVAPSAEQATSKKEFGTSRIARWFS